MHGRKNIKICFASSAGGHFEQLLMLKPLMDKYDSFIVTEKTLYQIETNNIKLYYLKQLNRKERWLVIKMAGNAIRSLAILIKEKPDLIICTGVLAMIPLCLLAKMARKKIVYIESFAKVMTPTETGKLFYKFADQFYVQWEPLMKYYPKAIYWGGIY